MSAQVQNCPQSDYPIRERAYTPEQKAKAYADIAALIEYSIRKRTMTRQQWAALTRGRKDAYGTRESNGLPHHPDGTGMATCPACDGVGETYRNTPVPWLQDAATCHECSGTGCVPDGATDPLLDMRSARKWSIDHLECMASYKSRYFAARKRAMRPSIGIAQLHMIESAIGCDLTMRDLLQSTRRAG